MKLRNRVVDSPPTHISVKSYWLRRRTIMFGINVRGHNGDPEEIVRGPRADCDPATTDIFCRWAAQAADQNLMKGGHLTKNGWSFIFNGFRQETGLPYTKVQIKNKWRLLKNTYKETKKLLGSMTGLGWDYERGTIMADDDWWEARIQQNPLAATLRGKRIPNLVDMERMFAPVRDLSRFGWSPQMGGNPRIPNLNGDSADSYAEDVGDTETQEPIHHVPNERDHPEGTSSGFSRRAAQNSDVFHAAGPSHVSPVGISHEEPRSARKSSRRKRKSGERDQTEMLSKISDYLTTGRKEQWTELAQAISDPNDMGLVMTGVAELPGVSYGDPFWMAAYDFFMENERAIPVFLRGCGGLGEVQLHWLRVQLQKRGGGDI